ncbi:hypothetical protein WG75_09500 [Citromicrobium sp. WPS32]|nr:hypothetical protein WG75_09500 [Citromicrobium sp. WPS32]
MHYARCQMCWKSIVVTLIQSKISQFAVLNDVLVEEAMKRPTLCQSQRGKVAFRVRIVLSN